MTSRTGFLLILASISSLTFAASPAKEAFAKLKTLEGKWVGGPNKDFVTTYKITGSGSALMEIQGPGTPGEMISMYYLDGDKLYLTHYCAAKNQPTMIFRPGKDPKIISFDFVSGTNMKKTDMHIHSAKHELVSPDHLKSTWTAWVDGKPGESDTFEMFRAKK
jgi:hypothetical protein